MASIPAQRGNTLVGFILGLVVGLLIALVVAVYVTKVPIPFMNKGLKKRKTRTGTRMRRFMARTRQPRHPQMAQNRTSPPSLLRLLPPLLLKTPWAIWQPAKPSSPMPFSILCKPALSSPAPTPRGSVPNWHWEVTTLSFLSASKRERSSTACAWARLTASHRPSKFKPN